MVYSLNMFLYNTNKHKSLVPIYHCINRTLNPY